ncbi:MAG TPA: hypothetical protein ENN21_02945 [Spirochaetes bacterium]|nr:hypothetical protein [Spirochaetota bacterium]
MKKPGRIPSLTVATFALLSFAVVSFITNSEAAEERLKKTEIHKYTLLNAPKKGDPYSVQFPIKLEEPGLISVDVHVGGGKITGKGDPFILRILDARAVRGNTNKLNNKYIKKTVRFRKDKSATYPVDALELRQSQGKYVILLSNVSVGSHIVGKVTINYPAKQKRRVKRDK